jgi:hypothetical protein
MLLLSFFTPQHFIPSAKGSSENWWNAEWPFRKAVTISHNEISGVNENFPLLVSMADLDLGANSTDGHDVVFVDNSTGIKLDHEIEYYNNATGQLVAWVRMPLLTSDQDASFYVYYGNPSATDQQNVAAVWDSSYNLVLHLNETTGLHHDSTINGNDGTSHGALVQGQASRISGADQFDGIDDYIEVPHSDTISGFNEGFTISFWVRLNDTSRRQTILNQYDITGNQRSWYVEFQNSATYGKVLNLGASIDGIQTKDWYASFSPVFYTWYYVAIVWRSNAIPEFYVDGEQVPTIRTDNMASIFDSQAPLHIGKSTSYAGRQLKGSLDEVQLSGAARLPSWILTSYATQRPILTKMWTASGLPMAMTGPLIYDVDRDGKDDIITGGNDTMLAIRGMDGRVIWNVSVPGVGEWCQPQMADINRDGIPEIIVPLEAANAGIAVLNSTNGSLIWRKNGLGGMIFSSPVIGDIDGSGYPTIFVPSEDVDMFPNGSYHLSGRVTSLSWNGTILHQTFAWRPCAGGLSLADTDNDGVFELYMGDRSQGYPDGGYGRGVRSFWAENLTVRWEQPDILSSSHKPMLVDLNADGKMEVVVGNQRGSLFVLNATNGNIIRRTNGNQPEDIPQHYQPSIYDIDGDGNLEIALADGDHCYGTESNTDTPDIVIWDLVQWKVDHRMNVGQCRFPPKFADVTGDGIMDIVACNYSGVFVFDRTYSWAVPVDQVAGLSGVLSYPVFGDVDGDGQTEIVAIGSSGKMYAFDTPGLIPNPRPRSEVQFFSERRLGAYEYVPPPGRPDPLVSLLTPQDGATNVPLAITRISFRLVDFQYDPVNYSVTTYPYIGSDNKTNVGNGMYSVAVSNLDYNKTYTLRIDVTDGEHWTNETYTFSTEAEPSWWDLRWQYRRAITIDPSEVNEDQINFPLLLDITDSNLTVGHARTDGGDFVFIDANNTKLNHEIEAYENTDGHLVAWINVPFMSSTSFTRLYMYYGNPNAEDQQNRTIVWDAHYKMVLHLNENTGLHYDSTINGNNGTSFGNVVQGRPSKIDGGDGFNGISDYVEVPHSDAVSGFAGAFTATFWLRLNDTSRRQTVLSKWFPQNGQKGWYIEFYPNHPTYGKVLGFGTSTDGNNSRCWYASFSPELGKWYSIAVIWTSNAIPEFYIDGTRALTKISNTIASIYNNIGVPLAIGKGVYSSWYLNGSLDEVRLSDTNRSASWVLTDYNNQEDPSTFCALGDEEELPQAPAVTDPFPLDGAVNVPLDLQELSFNITDYQFDFMNYTITTSPDIGSSLEPNVMNGVYYAPISGLDYSTTYTWTVNATDGNHTTIRNFTFSTLKGNRPPKQSTPLIVSSSGANKTGDNLIAYNQSTYDPDFDKVTNIFNWYKNGTSLSNLLMPFDTNSTTEARDYSGYGNNGTIHNAEWTSQGIIGGAYSFSGNDSYILIPNSITLDGNRSWSRITVELWVKLTVNQTGRRIIAEAGSYQFGLQRYKATMPSNRLYFGIVTKASYYEVEYSTPLVLNTWYHVVGTYAAGVGSSIYINGTNVPLIVSSDNKTIPSGTIWNQPGKSLEIGRHSYYPTSSCFAGVVDEVKIYGNLTLSPQQISQNYAQSKDGFCSDSTIVTQQITVGDVWKCQVTPNDAQFDGQALFSNSIAIVWNNKPSVGNLAISPSIAYTDSDLTASYTYYDADGDMESGTEIRWYKDGTLQPNLNDTLIVSSNLTQKGDVWYFTVRPCDGKEFGEIQTSPEVTILNSPPVILSYYPEANVTIPGGNSQEFNVTCSDSDGDMMTIEWWVDGTLMQVQTGTFSSFTLNTTEGSSYTSVVTVIVKDNESQAFNQWTVMVG